MMRRMRSQRLHPAIVVRPRLLARLPDIRAVGCVVIQGPAGSGKTVLALQWRAQLAPHGHDSAWCAAASGEDGSRLADHLVAALDRVDPALAREAALLREPEEDAASADQMAIHLLSGIARHGRPLVLFIDDYHHVGAQDQAVVQTLLDFAPPHLCVVLVSRTVPALSLSRLRDAGALVELGFQDLRFTFAEAEALLRARAPAVARRDVRLLYDQTGGWGAGLGLAALEPAERPAPGACRAPLQQAADFAAYFDREVIAHMPRPELDALVLLSAAHRFSDALAAALLGADAGLALMNRLRRDNLFLLPVDSPALEPWWRLHPLFRDIMQARFARLPWAERRDTHAALGRWFGGRGLLLDAVRHCTAAQRHAEAADLVERDARALFLAGAMRPLVRAVSMLEPAERERRGALLLWQAWAQLCHRQLAACRAGIARLQAAPEQDARLRHHRLLLEASLAIQSEDTDAGEQLVAALEALRTDGDAILVGGRRNVLGWLHIHQGRIAQARDVLDQPALALDDGTPLLDSAFGALQGRCMLGYAHLREGQLRPAEQVLQDVLDAADRATGPLSEPACNAASFLAVVLYEANQLDALRAVLEPRFNVIERVALPEALVCAAMSRVRLSVVEHNHLEALAELDRLDELVTQRGLLRGQGYVLAERVRLLLRQHEGEEAARYLVQLESLAGRSWPVHSAVQRELHGAARAARAWWLLWSGRPAQSLGLLEELASSGIHAGQARRLAQLDAAMVLALDQLGHAQDAGRRMDTLLQTARKAGLVRSLLDAGSGLLDIGDAAHRAGLLSNGSSFYLEHLTLQHGATDARAPEAPVLAAPPSLSEREREILQALAQTMSNKRVAQALAIAPETVKWHLKNIYGKLGVYGRDDAVAKARALGWV
jgi:LuxR family maltose regulon positive regulatory protein